MTDLRLRIASPAGVSIYYPDVMVVCGEAEGDEMHIESPTVIFEVLSESTERIDRREKYLAYQKIPSLKQYVLVVQDGVRVESFSMGSGEPGEVLKSITGTLDLPSLGCELSLAEIYAGVEGLAVCFWHFPRQFPKRIPLAPPPCAHFRSDPLSPPIRPCLISV